MRKYSAYILAIAALLLASCSGKESEPILDPEDHCIVLTFTDVCPPLETKASVRGVTDYNENYIQKVDCFFYRNGETDQPAVFTAMGRGAEVRRVAPDSLEYTVKIFFTDAVADDMFGSHTSGTCQAYVICNAHLLYGSDTSVDALKELVVENDFAAQTVQGSFVMSAKEPSTVTLTTTSSGSSAVTSASGQIKVMRSAAKMQLYFFIPNEFYDTENNQYWYPALDIGVQIRMANLVRRGKVDGNYTVQTGDYVTTRYRDVKSVNDIDGAALVPGMEEYSYTSIPFYSYPQNWHDLSDYAPAFIFRIPWRMGNSTNYEYRTYQLSPNMSGLKFERNHCYRSFVRISSLGGADEDHYTTITDASYYIIDWLENANAGQGYVPGNITNYKYLVVDEPNISLDNEEQGIFAYVSSSPIKSIKVTKCEYYDNNQAQPLMTNNAQTTITNDVQTVNEGDAGSFTFDKSTPGIITVYRSLENTYSSVKIYATLTNEDDCTQDITFEQYSSINLVRQSAYGDVFVNGYFARVAGSSFGGNYTANGTRYYYSRSATIYSQPGSQNGCIVIPPDQGYGSIIQGSGTFSGGISTTFYTSVINITSFNEGNYTYNVTGEQPYVYRIGDPRVPSSTHYNGANSWSDNSNFKPYLYNETTSGNNTTPYTRDWTDPESIMITSQAVEDRNLIAPKILVCSALNAMLTTRSVTFDYAVKRGATYQEAGYPAGRWRLPSEAEVAFIVARQRDGAIPNLFAEGSTYWVGSGRQVYIPTSGNSIEFRDVSHSDQQSCRFVYDLWFWGDEPSTTNVYHPDGHIYYYDADGNKTLITR